jgi:hypothetical protein
MCYVFEMFDLISSTTEEAGRIAESSKHSVGDALSIRQKLEIIAAVSV